MTTTAAALNQLGANLNTTGKKSMTTANIYDGVLERFEQRGSITPKQALWTMDGLNMAGIPIPSDFKQYIEIPGTEIQKAAYSKVCAKLPAGPDINDRAVDDILSGGTVITPSYFDKPTVSDADLVLSNKQSHREALESELQKIRESVMKLNDLIADMDQ